MEWKFNDDRPIYAQLVEQMQLAVVTGVYPPGSQLPPVRELASEAGVNPNTMQRALAELESAGLMHTRRTAGRFVTDDAGRISALRQALAADVVDAFLRRMGELGYSTKDIKQIVNETEEVL